MDSLMELQNLAVTVNGLKESVNLQAVTVTTISSENIHTASKYHSTFGQLLYKYSVFANEYKLELQNLHQALLNDINLKKKDREEQERKLQEKSELLSGKAFQSNLEIVENVEEIEYFSENSANINSISLNLSSNDDSEFEHSQNTSSIDVIPSEPQPIKSKKSIPVSPKPSPKSSPKRDNTRKSYARNNKNQKKEENTIKPAAVAKTLAKSPTKPAQNTKTKTASKPLIVRTADINKKRQKNDEDKYVYNEKNVKFNLPFQVWNRETMQYEKKVYKHTTMIFVGNIPLNIKVLAIQYFIMKKFKVTLRQIVNTMLYQARNGFNQYALVMFRNDVPTDHITKCMNKLNRDNAKIKDDKKAIQDKGKNIRPSAKSTKTSWQTRVFIKYQEPEYHHSYYENEDEMYNDPRARHELFIRNFDILDQKFHRKFTEKLLKFGDLYEDIKVKIDRNGNPCCIVIFKYKNDAIYCCNSDIYFGGNRLDIRYSNKISYLDDLNKHQ